MRRVFVKIKYTYTYTKYQDYPVATDISQNRESLKSYVFAFIVPFTILGWFLSETLIAKVAVVTVAVLIIVYLCTVYDKVTEKKINKVISEQIEREKKKYECISAHRINDAGVGVCWLCNAKSVKITRYSVKWPTEIRELPVCESCEQKLLANSRE